VKILPGFSGPAVVVQRVSSTSLEASLKLLRLEQAGDESPTRVLLPTLLASVDVNSLLEGFVGALLQHVAHCLRWSSLPRVLVDTRGSRLAARCLSAVLAHLRFGLTSLLDGAVVISGCFAAVALL
jgi:hypothetical protein